MKILIFRKILFIGLLFVLSKISFAQSTEGSAKYDLNIGIGAMYKIGEWIPGFELSGIIYSPERKISFGSRNIFLMKIEKIKIDSISYSNNFVLSRYHALNYFDFQYNLWQKTRHPSFFGIGLGWVYNGSKENYKQETYGYGVISFTLGYKVTWFYVDLRGDIPFDIFSNKNAKVVKLFPVTLGLTYRILPKK